MTAALVLLPAALRLMSKQSQRKREAAAVRRAA